MTNWNEHETVAESKGRKWARCQDCDKWKRAGNVRIVGNLMLCKKCWKKSRGSGE